ncbi:MAG TPA: TonB-dependent receptor [Longimicrobium sp.]|nr:TonB-dependent receptor [Longimicrobium sp.]
MLRATRRAALTVLLIPFIPTAAAAQQDSAALRDTVRFDPLVVTAGKVPVRASESGLALTVVPAQAARQPFAMDVLRALPASHMDEAAGPGGPAIVRLRGGEEMHTQVLVDGVQVNENGGFFDFQGLTLAGLDRVEVARGPQSAVYGSSAMSGVVNFVTRAGQPGRTRLEALSEGGEASEHGRSYRVTAGASGGSQALRWAAGAGSTYSRGHLSVPHDVSALDGSLRLDTDPAARWQGTATLRWIGVEGRLPVRDPGATRVPLDPNARYERDRAIASASARFAPGGAWSHQLRASAYRQRFVYDDEKDGVPAQSFFVFDANFFMESVLVRSGLEYVGSWDGRRAEDGSGLALTWGAQGEREALETESDGDFGLGEQALDRGSGALFGEARVGIGRSVRLMAGARAERYEGLGTEVTPRASAAIRIVPDLLTVRAAVARGYKAPNLQEQYVENPFIAGNPELEPERSASVELGVDAVAPDGRLSGGVTVFRQTFFDLIRTVPLEGTEKQINRNLGRSRATGVEWSARYAPGRAWAVGTDGAWIRTRIVENSGLDATAFPIGEALPGRPDVVGAAYLEVSPVRRLTGTIRGTYVGGQTVLSERFSGARVEVDPYLLASVGADYALWESAFLYARLDNAFNAEYETAFDRPGAPMTLFVGVRLDTGARAR